MFHLAFMYDFFDFGQPSDLRLIRQRLSARFGRFRVEERGDPVGQFILSFIGSRTRDRTAAQALAKLMERSPSWDAIADGPIAALKLALETVTFSEKKAPELKQALRMIRARAGQINLDFLVDHDVEQALNYLEQIHGVGRKIAAATLNFSALRGRAFVVDTHVLRILRRFGFVGMHAETETAYDAVMTAADDLDADDLFELHWQMKSLGQAVCTHAHAECTSCPLSDICLRRVENGVSIVAQAPARVA
jgi:endonuclease III